VTVSYFARNVILSAFLRNPDWFVIGRERIFGDPDTMRNIGLISLSTVVVRKNMIG
jgi:hypothetical protein